MTRSRLRVVPWAAGICLLAASLVGANRLLHPADKGPNGGDGGPPGAKQDPAAGGLIVLGYADSDPVPTPVGPPGGGLGATVTKVLVKDGDEVRPGTPLVQFDDAMPRAKLKQAEAELAAARTDRQKAALAQLALADRIRGQEVAVRAAETNLKDAQEVLQIGRDKLERVLAVDRDFATGQPYTEAQKAQRRREDLDIRKGELAVAQLRDKVEAEKVTLAALQARVPVTGPDGKPVTNPDGTPRTAGLPDLDAEAAEQKERRLLATVEEAQAAINSCLRKADRAGVVEQVTAVEGMTVGPSSRGPLLWIVPAGPRVVRAEVEAEFAHKMAGKEGGKVTVCDASNFNLTYDGTVRRIGTSFLPKRSALDAIGPAPARVLEVLIDVPDPAPTGKPPLRVGQPVRVSVP